MPTKFSPSSLLRNKSGLLRNKSGIALVVLALVVGGISAQASGILNSPSGGYLVCIAPKTNLVTHPPTTKCPKGYTKLILGAKGANGAIGLSGAPGSNGATGQTGPQGIAGIGGAAGVAGAKGATILQGTGTLTNDMGVSGDYYFNSALRMIYGPKANGSWPGAVSLAGANGANGAPGSNGTNGSNATLTCAQGGTCIVGDTGPGGGKVFYVQTATTAAPWRYLEAAPNSWSGGSADPAMTWCSNTLAFVASLTTGDTVTVTTGVAIGSGARNTKSMLGTCTFGAANMAASYNGGGKSDWFLPSKDELNALYTANTTVGGFEGSSYYWSSSEAGANGAWRQNFGTAGQVTSSKAATTYVRPVRAF